jgi:hypothetical protein
VAGEGGGRGLFWPIEAIALDASGAVLLRQRRRARQARRPPSDASSIVLAMVEIASCNVQTCAIFWQMIFEALLRPRAAWR